MVHPELNGLPWAEWATLYKYSLTYPIYQLNWKVNAILSVAWAVWSYLLPAVVRREQLAIQGSSEPERGRSSIAFYHPRGADVSKGPFV